MAACSKDAAVQPVTVPPVVTDINLKAETAAPVQTAVTLSLNSNVGGFYASVPANYSSTSKSYPLIISIHGGGQYGNGALDLPLLLNDGVPQLIDEKIFPPNITVKGIHYSFIVIAPQLKQFPAATDIKDVIDYAKKTYRIDSSRVYITGLSNGGVATCIAAGTYANKIAAIVPVAGEYPDSAVCSSLARNKVAIWAFHNSNDPVIPTGTAMRFISMVNSFSPPLAPRLTVFQSDKHDAWTRAINPAYKEDNMNIYEWMLQYAK